MSLIVPAVDIRLKSALIATDFSEASEKRLRHALAIARHYGSKFYLAHVISSPGFTLVGPEAVIAATEAGWRDARQLEGTSGALSIFDRSLQARQELSPAARTRLIHEDSQAELQVVLWCLRLPRTPTVQVCSFRSPRADVPRQLRKKIRNAANSSAADSGKSISITPWGDRGHCSCGCTPIRIEALSKSRRLHRVLRAA